MANPKGIGGKRFVKGQSGNPGGGKKLDPFVKEFKETSYKDFINQLQKYGKLTRLEMQADLQRPEATMFEIMFGQIVASAAKGDKDARQVLLERLWGKVKDSIEFKDMNEVEREKIRQMPMSELKKMIKQITKDDE